MKNFIFNQIIYCFITVALLFAGNTTHAQWATSGSKIYNTNSGFVGVGTSSPGEKFEVVGSGGTTRLRIRTSTNNHAALRAKTPNADYGWYATGDNNSFRLYDYSLWVDRITVTGNGNVGIGTASPGSKLDVKGKIRAEYNNGQFTAADMDDINKDLGGAGIAENFAGDLYARAHWGIVLDRNGGNAGLENYTNGSNPDGGSLAVRFRTGNTTFRTDLLVNKDGKVGIGTTSPVEKLDVNGSMRAGKVIIGSLNFDAHVHDTLHDATGESYYLWVEKGVVAEDYALAPKEDWDDYVFNENYNLPALADIKAFVTKHKHLSAIPSQAEVQKKGYTVHEFNRGLLKTVEELTLHTIEQEEKIYAQEQRIKELEAQMTIILAELKKE